MSFREKSAWISLISILAVSAFFLTHIPWFQHSPASPGMVHALLYSVIALVVIEVVAHVAVAIRSPKEARTPRDERERLIDLRATQIAAYVYVAGSFIAIFSTLHLRALGNDAGAVGYGVVLAFVVALVVRSVAQIVYHRRGF